jgi:hypothetical protein
MPTVASTHSAKPNVPRVYPNNDRGTERKNIEAGNLRSGTDGRPLCLHCSTLKSQGK